MKIVQWLSGVTFFINYNYNSYIEKLIMEQQCLLNTSFL